jgi:hypothetical protein
MPDDVAGDVIHRHYAASISADDLDAETVH